MKVNKENLKEMLELFGIKNPKCAYCGKKLKINETAIMCGGDKMKIICNDIFCIMKYYIDEGD